MAIAHTLQVTADKPPQLITPSACTPDDTLYLHSIEQRLLFNIEITFIYRDSRPGAVELLRDSLSTLLVHYYFLAGRLRVNEDLGRAELLCNSAGVPFASAKANVSVSDLLLHHNQLTTSELKKLFLYVGNVRSIPDIPLLTVQVTEFTCGGLAVSFCATHTALDGISLGKFFNDYASLTRGEEIQSPPNPDRTFMKARFPLQITHAHTGLASLPCVPANLLFNPPLYDPESNPVPSNKVFRLFHFTRKMIESLKLKAISESDGSLEFCSSFEVLSAHLWQARTRAMHVEGSEVEETPSRLFMVVDVRKKLSNTPEGFVGNAITTAPCTNVPGEQVRNKALGFCVKKVQQTVRMITQEYVRSELDYCELNQCVLDLPGALLITTWCKLGYEDVDFGWGKPECVAPLAHGMTEYVILFPSCQEDGGVDVFIGLEVEQMKKFEEDFVKV